MDHIVLTKLLVQPKIDTANTIYTRLTRSKAANNKLFAVSKKKKNYNMNLLTCKLNLEYMGLFPFTYQIGV